MKKVNNPSGKGGFKENPHNINRTGEQRNSISLTRLLKKVLKDVEPKTGLTWEKLIIKRILKKAVIEGNDKMLLAIWAYIDGTPRQSVELSSKNITIQQTIEALDENKYDNLAKEIEQQSLAIDAPVQDQIKDGESHHVSSKQGADTIPEGSRIAQIQPDSEG